MEKSPAPALSTGLKILELIADKDEIGFNEISKLTGVSVSTLNRILKVLMDMSYILKNEKGKYILGSKLSTLARSNAVWNLLLNKASAILHEISTTFEVTTLLLGFSGESIIALDKVVDPHNIALQPIGYVSKQFISRPWGFVYMAQLSDKRKNILIQKFKNNDKKEEIFLPDTEIENYIDFVKTQGYSDDFGKINPQIRRIAVPIYKPNGEVTAALAIGTVSTTLTEEKAIEIAAYLKKKAQELSAAIA